LGSAAEEKKEGQRRKGKGEMLQGTTEKSRRHKKFRSRNETSMEKGRKKANDRESLGAENQATLLACLGGPWELSFFIGKRLIKESLWERLNAKGVSRSHNETENARSQIPGAKKR